MPLYHSVLQCDISIFVTVDMRLSLSPFCSYVFIALKTDYKLLSLVILSLFLSLMFNLFN